MCSERSEGAIHERQVGGERVLLLRSSDTDEVDVAAANIAEIGREGSLPVRGGRHQELRKTRLVERSTTGGESLDLLPISVDPDDVVAQRDHGGSVNGTEIPTTDNRNPH